MGEQDDEGIIGQELCDNDSRAVSCHSLNDSVAATWL